ncbi:single-stranded DNA-binding protein [Vibrio sp. PNB22_4_1]
MMSKGINKVIVLGNLGHDPEVKLFDNGNSICNLSIATSETWKDKVTGEKRETTEWHRVVLNNRLAEVAAQYLTKGSKVYVEGKLKTRKWQNQLGYEQYTTEIRANVMQMLDARSASNMGDSSNAGTTYSHPEQQNYKNEYSAPTLSEFPNNHWEDDIPF